MVNRRGLVPREDFGNDNQVQTTPQGIEGRTMGTEGGGISPEINPNEKENIDNMSEVSKYLEQVRRDMNDQRKSDLNSNEPRPSTSTRRRDELQPIPSTSRGACRNQARETAQEIILHAEKYKENTNLPRGNAYNVFTGNEVDHRNEQTNQINRPMGTGSQGISDDEFFHLTCHVDSNLKAKIEKGEYIDLEKLLVKDKFKNQNVGQRMELVTKGGETFIMPVDKESKISNVRRWEQAFRIYAAIYSQANPHRSAEIWQYVFVINSAASTYIWENVASYDYTFHQLMSANPSRSWANIYLQMWNLTMRDVLPRNNSFSFGENGQKKDKRKGGGGRRPSYCWSYNRGEKCKFDLNCRFVKCCSYCDGGHPQIKCPKLKDKKNGK